MWSLFHYRQHHLRLGPLLLIWKATRRSLWDAVAKSAMWGALVMLLCAGVTLMALGAWLSWRKALPAPVLGVGRADGVVGGMDRVEQGGHPLSSYTLPAV